jgi:GTP-binding protein
MSLPTVAIVGRPNVGKSSIFNWLVGRRLAIVDHVAGVTRDRMIRVVEHEGSYFQLVDTGGIGINDVDDLDQEIEQQISTAIETADIILFAVDIRQGPTPVDAEIAKRLRALGKPLVLAANKADDEKYRWQAVDFYTLGVGDPLPVSAQNFRGKDELLDEIVRQLPKTRTSDVLDATEAPTLKIAIVGRRNVGKSTFVNSLSEVGRMIVSDVAGTTRDSVDVTIHIDGKPIVLIDTPGFRRRKSVRTDIEFYSTHRAQRSIRYADVVLLFFDAAEEIGKVDKKLVTYIEKQHKPVIFVVNKWDLVADKIVTQQWADYANDTFRGLKYVPIAFITAMEGKNVRKLINHAQMLFKQSQWRVSTPVLNRLIRQALLLYPPPVIGPRRPRIYFASQVGTQPPMLVLKCSDPDAFPTSYRRYLVGVLRDQLKFGEIPIRVFYEQRDSHSTPRSDRDGPQPNEMHTPALDRDLSDSDLPSLSPEKMQEWIAAQNRLDKRRTPHTSGTVAAPADDGIASDEMADEVWDADSSEPKFWDGDQPLPVDDPSDPTVDGSDDFDPVDFDKKAWSEIYEASLIDLPQESAPDDDDFEDDADDKE